MKNLAVQKILKILFIAIMILSMAMQMSFVFAADKAKGGTDYLNPSSVQAQESSAAASSQNLLWSILGIVQVVAISVAVIMLIVLGIKYISAAPGEKADIKQGAMIYVVGAILMFGATTIIQIIKAFAGQAIVE